MARNLLSQHHRSVRRGSALTVEVARLTADCRAEDVAEPVVERAPVLQAVSELTEQDREVLMSTVWDQLTLREAARVAGCSTPTFTVRLHRARRRLRDALIQLDSHSTAPHAHGVAAQPAQEAR